MPKWSAASYCKTLTQEASERSSGRALICYVCNSSRMSYRLLVMEPVTKPGRLV